MLAAQAQRLPERLPCPAQGSVGCLLRADGAMQELLTAALAADWTPKQALTLERTENVESVVDAVQRVASQLPQVLPSPGQLHISTSASASAYADSHAGHAADQKMNSEVL